MADLHCMTVDEYVAAARHLGWANTELVEGLVYDRSPALRCGAETVAAVYAWARAAYPDALVLPGGSVQLGPDTLVEPGLVVVGERIDLEGFVPAHAVRLVVEVIQGDVAACLGRKLQAYAQAGIPELWVIDPRAGEGWLLRHSVPKGELYGQVEKVEVGENGAALARVGLTVNPVQPSG